MPRAAVAIGADWVVCQSEHHDVVAGAVRCELSESTVVVADCLECHLLNYASDERVASRWCSTGEPGGKASAPRDASKVAPIINPSLEK